MHGMPQSFSTALLAAASFLLGSCAVGPRYHTPDAPPNAGYTVQPLPSATSEAAVDGGTSQHLVAGGDIPFTWWERFQSPDLNALVLRAFAANPTVSAAQAALGQAQELVRTQRGFFFPSIGAAFQAERHKVSGNTNSSSTIGVQGNGLNKLPAIPETPDALNTYPHNLPSYYTFYTAKLTVGFTPDVLGGNRRQVESLAAQAQAQKFALEATYITLTANVVAAVIQEASLRAQIRAMQDIAAADGKALEILEAQFKAGFVMRIDVAAQEAQLASDETKLPPLQKRLDQTRDLLRLLVGNLPNREDKTFELDALQLPSDIPVTLPANLIRQRPDIRAAEAQLHSANAQIGVAIAAMLPQLSVTGAYGGNATEVSQMFSSGGPFWNIYGDVTQPLFQGGTLLHQKRATSAAAQQALALYRSTVLTAYQNVADALHAVVTDADTLAADVDAESSAKVTYDLTHRQLEAGGITYLAVLSAEAAYQQTVLTRIQAQATRYGDTVALFEALGGGWWNRE